MKRNAIVAQSGGPSPVINASLQGVIEGCRDYPDRIGRVLAGRHGIEGVLQEQLIDLSAESEDEISRLRHTPAAGAIGTCRYKLKDKRSPDYQRILDVMKAHEVGYFFYIGGNDSMDTAKKVADLASEQGMELVVAGVPKTIDNDIGDEEFKIIDHTPGYGSAARYWASIVQNVEEENRGMCVSEPVAVLQAMGRTAGFIPAAARLADPGRQMPLQIYLAESIHDLESLAENVNSQLREAGRCIVVVSEGFNVGALGEAHDGFGHIEYGASQSTVAQLVVNHLNSVGLAARGQATGQVPGVLQRSTSIFASEVDVNEAYEVGRHAVAISQSHGTGWMATILRKAGSGYEAYYDHVPLEVVANSGRQIPSDWLTEDQLDITDRFVDYARPLIGEGWAKVEIENGLQRFARLDLNLVEKRLPSYRPAGYPSDS